MAPSRIPPATAAHVPPQRVLQRRSRPPLPHLWPFGNMYAPARRGSKPFPRFVVPTLSPRKLPRMPKPRRRSDVQCSRTGVQEPRRGWAGDAVMRVLDLGCGPGSNLVAWGVTDSDNVTGIDINNNELAIAKVRFPNRTYLRAVGEWLPFDEQSLDRIISVVALPYMNIQKALAEIHRTLVPGGGLSLTLHAPSFTFAELIHRAIPKPIPTIYRLYVIANGVYFHCTGKTVGFLRGRTESFQTERGMRSALGRVGFENVSFSRMMGPAGEMFFVSQTKSKEANFSSEGLGA